MKTNTMTHATVLTASLSILLITFGGLMSIQLSYAHNLVVVVPLDGDEAQQPTAPVAKDNPGQADYTITANDLTVIDKITKLEWQRIDNNGSYTWNEALDYCAGLNLDGKTDWRLPDIIELQSIVDLGQESPAIDGDTFTNTNSSGFWSASIRSNGSSSAWAVSFVSGSISGGNKTNFIYVRCVR